jgi:hypothetical protein
VARRIALQRALDRTGKVDALGLGGTEGQQQEAARQRKSVVTKLDHEAAINLIFN